MTMLQVQRIRYVLYIVCAQDVTRNNSFQNTAKHDHHADGLHVHAQYVWNLKTQHMVFKLMLYKKHVFCNLKC
jgi:hypothetical protein